MFTERDLFGIIKEDYNIGLKLNINTKNNNDMGTDNFPAEVQDIKPLNPFIEWEMKTAKKTLEKVEKIEPFLRWRYLIYIVIIFLIIFIPLKIILNPYSVKRFETFNEKTTRIVYNTRISYKGNGFKLYMTEFSSTGGYNLDREKKEARENHRDVSKALIREHKIVQKTKSKKKRVKEIKKGPR
jgi:hypothetical protein